MLTSSYNAALLAYVRADFYMFLDTLALALSSRILKPVNDLKCMRTQMERKKDRDTYEGGRLTERHRQLQT